MKKLFIIFLMLASLCALVLAFTACGGGKSAYELYKESYIQATGSEEGMLSESEWLLSLNGSQGDNGKSAYELYKEAYINATGSESGVLGETEWVESLKGDTGVGIKNVEIICGDIIITYDNDKFKKLEGAYPEAGHNWNEGVISTAPTCITPGITTFTCEACGAAKKELADSNGQHLYGEYESDKVYHWQTCKVCNEISKHEHDFGGKSADSDANELIECECGLSKTVGDFFAYKVVFECEDGASVLIYNTQDYSVKGTKSNVAYSRSKTGQLLNDGEGQVNFEIVVAVGYKLSGVTVTPSSGYKNCKGEDETNREKTYRITKITSELKVTVETEIDFLDLPVMVIDTENSASISDKENYVNCNVSVLNAQTEYCLDNVSAGIRGRGNTTWGLDKKPYKLKFNSKVDLFGNGKAKKWNLIANYVDPSLLRNYLAYSIAGENGILNKAEYTTTVQNIELYLNGEYCGVYLVCEQNETGSSRVNIDESLVNDDGSVKVDTGYLLELDSAYAANEGTEGLDFFYVDGRVYAIKNPETDDIFYIEHKKEFVGFIKNIVETAADNLQKYNYAKVSELLDIDSFVDAYLIDELTNTADVGFSSFYLYYDNADGKLHRGPIWDYDASCGNVNYHNDGEHNDTNNPEYLKASTAFWYSELLKFDAFQQAVKERLNEISTDNAFLNFLDDKVNEILACKDSFNRNFEKWNGVLGQSNLSYWNTDIIISLTTWEEQLDFVVNWLKTSYNYLISYYC